MQSYPTSFYCPTSGNEAVAKAALVAALNKQGIATNAENASATKTALLVWLEKIPPEIIIETAENLVAEDIRVIVLNFNQSIADLLKWQLLKLGVKDIVDWKDDVTVSSFIKARIERWALVESLLLSDDIKTLLVGESKCWKRFLRRVIDVAYFTNRNILLTGQSGTGKEMTAELIHRIDRRKNKADLVLVDCTTISPELSGSEFYGHEKGAFTNAIASREGAFAQANNGTLFLDELGELPLSMQAGLLRVIQEKTYKKVGSNTWRNTAFRLVAATNRDLKQEIKAGHFREDLYFRVASTVFTLPPLEERKEDIPELIRHFLRQELNAIVAPEVEPLVLNYLVAKNYQGNVRELKQLVSQIATRYSGQEFITAGDLPEDSYPDVGELSYVFRKNNQSLQESIRLAILSGKDLPAIKNDVALLATEIALEESGGNLKIAARKLNVEVRTLQYIRQKNSNGTLQ